MAISNLFLEQLAEVGGLPTLLQWAREHDGRLSDSQLALSATDERERTLVAIALTGLHLRRSVEFGQESDANELLPLWQAVGEQSSNSLLEPRAWRNLAIIGDSTQRLIYARKAIDGFLNIADGDFGYPNIRASALVEAIELADRLELKREFASLLDSCMASVEVFAEEASNISAMASAEDYPGHLQLSNTGFPLSTIFDSPISAEFSMYMDAWIQLLVVLIAQDNATTRLGSRHPVIATHLRRIKRSAAQHESLKKVIDQVEALLAG